MTAASITLLGTYSEALGDSLLIDGSGTIYGTATGADGPAIFAFAAGSFTTLGIFNDYSTTGGGPTDGLGIDGAGNVYATTYYGGPANGVADEVSLTSPLTAIAYSPGMPEGPPVADAAGDVFYASGGNTIYEVKAGSGTATVFASVATNADLTIGADGTIYGTNDAGASGYGSVFEITPDGIVTTLVNFDVGNGRLPTGKLVLDEAGNLYGNANNLFEIAAGTHVFTQLATFSDGGASEINQIAVDADGNIYGTTTPAGATSGGTVYELAAGSDSVTTLLDNADGIHGLTAESDGDLLGTVGDAIMEVVPCFVTGTLIATPDGDRRVETLCIGDPVITADGRIAPIKWIGWRVIQRDDANGYRFADALQVMPIRIKAGALGPNSPNRDLLLSPCHAVLIKDVLIQAGALVNGVSILREHHMARTFTYYHVELADHALILAEGLPAETFVDNVHRMGFDNWAEHQALYPNCESMMEMEFPRAASIRQVPGAIQHYLMDRAKTCFGQAAETIAA
ncbi:Hint domain-containing protein [Acidisoma cellulosilytica]|uniref:Hint domain-containing protein n=1 Tax=Acidisoma cellulosilyticum TaxID=2802395 RepID=A0A963Z1M8_9PROT|nr:Hint domain-containing protein [Acidisoma cellulosilyticum]MCB8881197.1 Hint domain-containing protein [Acidisoma cellulosilyticum]